MAVEFSVYSSCVSSIDSKDDQEIFREQQFQNRLTD